MLENIVTHLSHSPKEALIVGSFLLLWFLYDLFNGSVYLHRSFDRRSEPVIYWLLMTVWLTIAMSCFIIWK